jgi:hypothetical protein
MMTMADGPRMNVYLGDGLYGEFNGFDIALRTERMGTTHYVVLEPTVVVNLLDWMKALTMVYPGLAERWKPGP